MVRSEVVESDAFCLPVLPPSQLLFGRKLEPKVSESRSDSVDHAVAAAKNADVVIVSTAPGAGPIYHLSWCGGVVWTPGT
jgi:hypothetical protein